MIPLDTLIGVVVLNLWSVSICLGRTLNFQQNFIWHEDVWWWWWPMLLTCVYVEFMTPKKVCVVFSGDEWSFWVIISAYNQCFSSFLWQISASCWSQFLKWEDSVTHFLMFVEKSFDQPFVEENVFWGKFHFITFQLSF